MPAATTGTGTTATESHDQGHGDGHGGHGDDHGGHHGIDSIIHVFFMCVCVCDTCVCDTRNFLQGKQAYRDLGACMYTLASPFTLLLRVARIRFLLHMPVAPLLQVFHWGSVGILIVLELQIVALMVCFYACLWAISNDECNRMTCLLAHSVLASPCPSPAVSFVRQVFHEVGACPGSTDRDRVAGARSRLRVSA